MKSKAIKTNWRKFFDIIWIIMITKGVIDNINLLGDWYLGTIVGILGLVFYLFLIWIMSIKDWGNGK
jgi:hypothetical protein